MQWRKLIKQQLARIGLLLSLCVTVPSVIIPSVVVPLAAAADNITQRDTSWLRAWQDLQQLSADDMAGRATGTAGNEAARLYLQARFAELQLQKPGDSYFQPFVFNEGFSQRQGVNVLGLRRGCVHPDRYIVVTAHYDHLKPRGKKIFNGADDNASGVAGLLYLAAQTLTQCPAYSYWFLATDAEEMGLDGAKAFLAAPPVPRAQLLLNINLDMISRGEMNQRLYLAGKKQLPQLKTFAAAAKTPLKLTLAHDGRQSRLGRHGNAAVDWANASDHAVFRKAGLPYLYFGVDVHPQYHTPQDDWQRIDPDYFRAALELIEQSRGWADALPLAELAAAQKSSVN